MEVAHQSPAHNASKGRRKDPGRSRVTNGSALLPSVDGRSAWVRRRKDLISEHLVDLGGEDNASAAERSLIRRACVLTVELEQLEVKFATSGPASAEALDLYQRTSGGLRRLLETVGIRRRARDISPSLSQYLSNGHDIDEDEDESGLASLAEEAVE